MLKRNKMKKPSRIIMIFICAVSAAAVWFTGTGRTEELMRRYSGVPDAVSSMHDGESCRLTVVANALWIGDEAEFARKVAGMCRDNSFRSIKFSEDAGYPPEELDIKVYLQKSDIRKREPVMRLHMREESGRYRIWIGGREIDAA